MVHRRERYARLLDMLSDSERRWSIDDAITENLDLPGLLSDYLSQLRDAGECQRAFEVLSSLTVCDPTVGSGAFLFAALDVLEPLYGTLLARAEELDARGQPAPDFYAEARRHPNEQYWALKTVCLHSLYGVDIMAEAPEVAKLRLFLKLTAQIDRVEDLEPLPDLDFNIKCGNLLVGVRDGGDAAKRIAPTRADGQLSLDSVGRIGAISAVATEMADAYDAFVAIQATHDHRGVAAAKNALQARSRSLRADCDDLLHGLREETAPLDQWVASHQPFHWFIEFPSIWRNGGFDVIIGNPPYIKAKDVTDYRWVGYATAKCPDLYAVCVERASTLLNNNGRFAMIVMHSLCFHKGFETLRNHLQMHFEALWISSFSRASDSLFSGSAKVRNSIIFASQLGKNGLFTTRCHRWLVTSRPQLFSAIEYGKPARRLLTCGNAPKWPFGDDQIVLATFATLANSAATIEASTEREARFQLGFKTTAGVQTLGVYISEPPTVNPATGEPEITSSESSGWFRFNDERHRDIALMCLGGRWGYLWWLMFGDEFHVTREVLAALPCDITRLMTANPVSSSTSSDLEVGDIGERIISLSQSLQSEMVNHVEYNLRGSGSTRVLAGRYRVWKLRHLTDEADWLLAQAWGLSLKEFEAAGNLRDRMIFGNKE
ncbi:MAG: Eco57I restriction-modification methylase domain-containing protein [bacterium]|nr:Eco57I restriction-modification methylase domain-containing protein [bacterium]